MKDSRKIQVKPRSQTRPAPVEDRPSDMRRRRGLLGFLTKAEMDFMFTQLPISPATAGLEPAALWRNAHEVVAGLPPYNFTTAEMSVVPDLALPIIEQVKQRPSFKRWYEAIGDYSFALVPFDVLITPQWDADWDYVEELSTKAPSPDDWSGAFAFSLHEGVIGKPVINQNQVIFTSHRPDLFCSQIPEIRATEPGVYEIVLTAQSRPNYIQVLALRGRFILANGVHRTLAMKRAGYNQIPCVIREINAYADLPFNSNLSLLREEHVLGPRPAMVADFLDERLAVSLYMRATDQVLRVSVGVEPLTVPAFT